MTTPDVTVIHGDAFDVLATVEPESVDCVVTSPPYYRHRLYDGLGPDQLGQERTVEEFVEALVAIFARAARALRRTGTCWVVIGDSYERGRLQFVPARLALALEADGWVPRSQIVWQKPNPVPGWGRDRPVSAHEMVLLLTRIRTGYLFDAGVLREPARWEHWGRQTAQRVNGGGSWQSKDPDRRTRLAETQSRQGRDVWTIPTERAFAGAMPLELAGRCIRTGSPRGGTVLDPFAGTGTTIVAAQRLGRIAIGIEASETYVRQTRQRLNLGAQEDLFSAGGIDAGAPAA